MNGWVVLLWSLVAILFLTAIGIFVSLVLMGRITFGSEPVQSSPPPETGVVDTTYGVLVLNATPEDGLDVEIYDALIDAGWASSSLSRSDAATSEYPTTTVVYLTDEDRKAALGVAEIIGRADVLYEPDYPALAGWEGKQLAVVIGLDRTAGAQPPATSPAE